MTEREVPDEEHFVGGGLDVADGSVVDDLRALRT